MKQPRTKGATRDQEILAKAGETARAFAELAAALGRRIDRVWKMDDETPEAERLRLAIRTGLVTEKQKAVRDVLHCVGLTRPYFQEDGTTNDLLNVEPHNVAGHVAAAAQRLAVVIGAVAVEFDDAETENAARALRRTRRAA
jgi:hypothetical protein